ncbi:MAG: c-type cytochrome [Lutibacter sp.]|jgi:cytochrome c|uniref:c-type cytochrome n=1 Tax=Lutibacter sp. TaxID=1925666 RepID=UPI00184BE85E|nr:c-type cytochrome [Lutibacter sp.]MBT8316193.1 c-type cytochrome [Lutibacter sp.]NNJ57053.1 c-type cytochrome [Lutibacter sp.]
MKKSVLALGLVAVFLTSCGDKKKEEVKKEVETKVEAVKEEVKAEATDAVADNLELGKKLFTEKTCATCHNPDMKVIGPSIKEINKVYAEQNANMVKFLKGESPAIVDTDPGQVAIMKANLDGFVKDMTGDELAAITAYMRSVK